MITRRHSVDGTDSTATYSDCEAFRYSLTRSWDTALPHALFVMLNPSTANEMKNDPTVGRCETRARRSGYGTFTVCNLFAFRATLPTDLRRAEDPVGPDNDAWLSNHAARADLLICAWGVHGAFRQRGDAVARLLADTGRPMLHLGLTTAGHPRHPLYLSYAVTPEPWEFPAP